MTVQARPIKRLYTMEDEEMQTRAQTMHSNLLIDLAAFTAKFSWFDAAFILSFLTDITTAKNYELDMQVVNLIKVLTADLKASTDEGMRALDLLDIYARIAYPTDITQQRVFGQKMWEKARNDQQKMYKALKMAHNLANAAPYKAALLAASMQQTDIDNLLTAWK
jgi:hypothetical protein